LYGTLRTFSKKEKTQHFLEMNSTLDVIRIEFQFSINIGTDYHIFFSSERRISRRVVVNLDSKLLYVMLYVIVAMRIYFISVYNSLESVTMNGFDCIEVPETS
jgi:hypothetical protein